MHNKQDELYKITKDLFKKYKYKETWWWICCEIYLLMMKNPFSIKKILEFKDFWIAKLFFWEEKIWHNSTVGLEYWTSKYIFEILNITETNFFLRYFYIKNYWKIRTQN